MSEDTRPPSFEILPWQRAAWERVQQARRNDRLPHAQLITGLPGLGKLHFAYHLAHALLCTVPAADGSPCGRCRGCHLFQVGNHPDLRRIGPDPESKSGEIKVDAIRDLADLAGLSAQAGGYKVVIVAPAERMNRNAANSLLKTLEEPTPSTLLFLVSAEPGRLLPTLRSRCQRLPLTIPAEDEALAWLATRAAGADPLLALRLAHGAPLTALQFFDPERMQRRREALEAFFGLAAGRGDPLAIAEHWLSLDLPLMFEWLSGWLADMLRLQVGAHPIWLNNPDIADALAHHAMGRDPVGLHRLWSQAVEARRQLQTNLNPQLLLETLLIQWSGV